MRKKLLSVLLVLCMAFSLLPATALADYDDSYEAFVARVEAGSVAYIYDSANFPWPDEEVTLDVKNTISPAGDWTIPSNVTLNFIEGSSGKSGSIQMYYDSTLTVEGTINTNTVGGNVLNAKNVVLKKGGSITTGTGRFSAIHVSVGATWTIEEGANLEAALRLDGNLHGENGTVSGNIWLWPGYSSTDSDVTLSGELTLTGSIDVETYTYAEDDGHSKPLKAKLTIAENSTITTNGFFTFGNNVDLDQRNEEFEYTYQANYPTMQIDGELIVNKAMSVADESKITLGDSGVLNLQPGARVYFSKRDEGEVKTFAVVDGAGTIKVCVTQDTNNTSVFGYYPLWNDMSECPNIADTVNVQLWRSWIDCDHVWSDWEVTKEATCGEDGVKSRTCSECGTTETESIPATGEHTWDEGVVTTEPTCTEAGVMTYTCTVCGETRTEEIPATGHTPDGNTDCEKETLCTVCGAVLKEAGEHTWDEGVITTEPTCTEAGVILYTCVNCGATKEETAEALGHDLVYTADGAVITETCTRGDHEADVTVTAENAVYTGEAVETASVTASEGWSGGDVTITYENNVNAGTATAGITVGDATASVQFTIEKAEEYTLTLSGLSQYSSNVKDVTYTLTPADATAVVVIEYGTDVEATPCTHEHTEECDENGENCAHVHDDECGYSEAHTEWSTEVPTDVGTYKVRARVTSSDNLAVSEDYTEGTLTISRYVAPSNPTRPSTPSTTTPSTAEPETNEPVNVAEVYNDVSDDVWYLDAVSYVVENGLMSGYDDVTFAPNDDLSRAMIAQILFNSEDKPENKGVSFADVENGAWYADAVAWANENGIVTGYNDGTFGGDDAITREQLAVILFRYAQLKGYDVTARAELLGFADAENISAYALEAMRWANAEGLITGVSSTELDPTGTATRAQVATILMRFFENVAE